MKSDCAFVGCAHIAAYVERLKVFVEAKEHQTETNEVRMEMTLFFFADAKGLVEGLAEVRQVELDASLVTITEVFEEYMLGWTKV